MKTSTFQKVSNINGLRSLTFMPAERGLMLSRLERLRQMAVASLEDLSSQDDSFPDLPTSIAE